MRDPKDIPEALLDGGSKPGTCGFVQDQWYYEEDGGTSRLGLRITKKLHEEQSGYQKLSIYQTPFFGKLFTLDDVIMFTERDEFVYHEMLTHLPLCTMPDPKDVLVIGGGDCGCMRELLRHPGIQRVVQCDIDERVTKVCEEFFPWVRKAQSDPRAQIHFADGVEYVDRCRDEFDLIIIDSTDPKGPGVGLFLREFYEKVSRALKPGGVMVAQTESPHWDPEMVGAIYREIKSVFKNVHPYVGPVPTYPSGYWSWAWASMDRKHDDHFSEKRAQEVTPGCMYYNKEIHKAAFALPNFVLRALGGDDPFDKFRKE